MLGLNCGLLLGGRQGKYSLGEKNAVLTIEVTSITHGRHGVSSIINIYYTGTNKMVTQLLHTFYNLLNELYVFVKNCV